MEQQDLEQQIERCLRLASQVSDNMLRNSLEALAAEYRARLRKEHDSFMLGSKSPRH